MTGFKIFALLLAPLLLFAAPVHARQNAFPSYVLPPGAVLDAAGFRVGMTEAEFRSHLTSSGFSGADTPGDPRLVGDTWTEVGQTYVNNFKETLFNKIIGAAKNSRGANTSKKEWGEVVAAAFLGPPNQHQIWAVRRTVLYTPETSPTYQEAVSALIAKYGKPTVDNLSRTATLYWGWDASGRLLSSPGSAANACAGVAARINGAVVGVQVQRESPKYAPNIVVQTVQPFSGIYAWQSCPHAIQAVITTERNSNLVKQVSVAVGSALMATEGAMRTGAYVDALSRAAQLQKPRPTY